MAKVYDFPVKKLQEEVEERLYFMGREYGAKMGKALDDLIDEYDLDLSKEEIMELIIFAYANGVIDAMEEL